MKTILIIRKQHYKYNYLAHWITDGIPFTAWFTSKKDIDEYFSGWSGYRLKYMEG